MLKAVSYTSRASLDLLTADVVEIHQTSQRFNQVDGITGLLVFNGVRFLQIIEGPTSPIDNLVERLRRDKRHSALEIRDERIVESRWFPAWSMQLVQVNAGYFRAREEIGSLLPEELPTKIRDLLDRMCGDDSHTFDMPD